MKAQWTTYLQVLLPIVVPLLISQGKKLLGDRWNFLIPLSAPVLGALVDFLQSFVSGAGLGPAQAAVFGALGVFLREVVDQIRQAQQPPAVKAMIAWFVIGLTALGFTACATTGIGKAIQAADTQKQLVERAAVEFVKLKLKGDARITPAVYDQGRAAYEKYQGAQAAVAEALASWKVVKSAENESKLQAALTEVTKHIDVYLAFIGRFINLDELKKKLQAGELPSVADGPKPVTWAFITLEARLTWGHLAMEGR